MVTSLPNIITLGRLLLVPAIIWFLVDGAYLIGLVLFVVAGVSDAVDGFLAKRLNAQSRLGAYLDPIADKALLVSIYITLGLADHLASWLVILVVSRDILIIGAVLLAMVMGVRLKMEPLRVSKINTVAQIGLAAFALALAAFAWPLDRALLLFTVFVGLTTGLSAVSYLRVWLFAVSEGERRNGGPTGKGRTKSQ